MGGNAVFSDPLRKATIISEKYETEKKAHERKDFLKQRGYVATVTPVFLRWTKAQRRKLQSAPFGHDCRKDWHLYGDGNGEKPE